MKKIIYTKKAPDPVGPYSQAIFVNSTLYISGQVAINPETGKIENSNIENETLQVMKNLEAILNEVGFNFKNVIKSSIFLSDMNNFNAVNKVYGSFFSVEDAPARVTVEVSRLPMDVNVEIDMIAT
ncbi:MAG: RidA family protein [Flavobacteriales bacterium]|jgi:2-iminobutanoate/2-iminopropanoate deaminase|nr:MAG: RidA family protein [Flavobacteriales bacterium]|tara:strand:+ start:291 stop:668 length:378 start_codon:yes stop_codon:yes gene_type:complete